MPLQIPHGSEQDHFEGCYHQDCVIIQLGYTESANMYKNTYATL